jgi:hypothetical protein
MTCFDTAMSKLDHLNVFVVVYYPIKYLYMT